MRTAAKVGRRPFITFACGNRHYDDGRVRIPLGEEDLFISGCWLLGENSMQHARPNILWVCTDQQRWDTIRSLGNSHIRSPNIDRLVAEGVAFARCYAQSPICTPSRANLMKRLFNALMLSTDPGQPRVGVY